MTPVAMTADAPGPSFQTASSPFQPVPDVQGANKATPQSLERTHRVVLTDLPNRGNSEEFNRLADQLITSLNSSDSSTNGGTTDPATQAAAQEEARKLAEQAGSAVSSTAARGTGSSGRGNWMAQAGNDPWVGGTDAGGAATATGITQFQGNRAWSPEPAKSGQAAPVAVPVIDESKVWGAQPVAAQAPQAAAPTYDDEGSYVLGPGDAVDITVWEMPELARALFVRPDGYISYPLIHEVRAAGKTPSALAREMEQRLAAHLVDPQVNIIVTSTGSKAYYVFGAVASPGVFQYFRQLSLMQAIVAAGGFQSVAHVGQPVVHGDLSRIRVIRTHATGREVITKNFKDLDTTQIVNEDIPILPEDIVYVPQESKMAFIFGEVGMAGVIPIQGNSRVLEVILTAGGIRPTGRKDQVLLIRPGTQTTPTTYACINFKALQQGNLAANLPVQSGDIIYVPQKFIAKVAEFVALYTSALQPAMETYLTSWDAWFVHERFSALRANQFGVNSNNNNAPVVNPDP